MANIHHTKMYSIKHYKRLYLQPSLKNEGDLYIRFQYVCKAGKKIFSQVYDGDSSRVPGLYHVQWLRGSFGST